ncbi:MAG: hypothetical protein MZV49_05530 [Rhodopseudomonas palustris]|nr:hypothetical protein [Rhodopseudomonas palustris]
MLRVDLEVDGPMNVASVRYSRRLDSLKDDIEVVLTHSKAVVNRGKRVGPFIKVDGQSIVHLPTAANGPTPDSDQRTPSSSANSFAEAALLRDGTMR